MLKLCPSRFRTIFPTRMASGAAPYHRDRRCLRFCHLKHCRPTSQFCLCPKSRRPYRPVLNSSREHRQWVFEVRARIVNHPSACTRSHFRTKRFLVPFQVSRKTADVEFPRGSTVFLSTQQDTCYAFCDVNTQKDVSNVQCAVESEP